MNPSIVLFCSSAMLNDQIPSKRHKATSVGVNISSVEEGFCHVKVLPYMVPQEMALTSEDPEKTEIVLLNAKCTKKTLKEKQCFSSL